SVRRSRLVRARSPGKGIGPATPIKSLDIETRWRKAEHDRYLDIKITRRGSTRDVPSGPLGSEAVRALRRRTRRPVRRAGRAGEPAGAGPGAGARRRPRLRSGRAHRDAGGEVAERAR